MPSAIGSFLKDEVVALALRDNAGRSLFHGTDDSCSLVCFFYVRPKNFPDLVGFLAEGREIRNLKLGLVLKLDGELLHALAINGTHVYNLDFLAGLQLDG